MNGEQFVAQVRTLAELEDNDRAERAIQSTFQTLRERLAGNEPADLAAQLPPEVAEPLSGSGDRDDFTLEEFYRRVAQKEGASEDEARRHARAVVAVTQEAVTEGELDDIREQLRPEYEELFGEVEV